MPIPFAATKVDVGPNYGCALVLTEADSAAKLYCWGNHLLTSIEKQPPKSFSELSEKLQKRPRLVSQDFVNMGQSLVKDFAIAGDSTCAILEDDSIACRGQNYTYTDYKGLEGLTGEVFYFRLESDQPVAIFGASDSIYVPANRWPTDRFCVTTKTKRIYCWTAHDVVPDTRLY